MANGITLPSPFMVFWASSGTLSRMPIECGLISAGVAAASIHRGQKVDSGVDEQARTRKNDDLSQLPCAALLRPSLLAGGQIKETLELCWIGAAPFSTTRCRWNRNVPSCFFGTRPGARRAESRFKCSRTGCRVFGDHETLSRLGRLTRPRATVPGPSNTPPSQVREGQPSRLPRLATLPARPDGLRESL